MDFNKTEKKIADTVWVAHNPQTFILGFLCGDQRYAFVLDPKGAKAFSANLAKHIADYESQVGTIDITGMDPVTLSPLQRS